MAWVGYPNPNPPPPPTHTPLKIVSMVVSYDYFIAYYLPVFKTVRCTFFTTVDRRIFTVLMDIIFTH